MESIKISNSMVVNVFDSQDFTKNNKQINEYLNSVLGKFVTNGTREYLDDLNGDIFLQDKKIFIYILFEASEPVSFAIYSKKSSVTANLDLIYTSNEYSKLGFATMLLRLSAMELKNKNVNTVIVKVDEENYALQNLLDSFAKAQNVVCDKKDFQYKFNIKNINSNKILDDIKKLAIK